MEISKNEYSNEFKKAVKMRDNSKFAHSIAILEDLAKTSWASKDLNFHLVSGGVYRSLNDHVQALKCFKKASILFPESELASLGLYLSYVKADKSEKAISELKRYLDKYPAKLYKDTLAELLDDFNSGYATNFKNTVLSLAKRNKVVL